MVWIGQPRQLRYNTEAEWRDVGRVPVRWHNDEQAMLGGAAIDERWRQTFLRFAAMAPRGEQVTMADELSVWERMHCLQAVLADFARLLVLYQHGGLYSDHDAAPLRPVDEWLFLDECSLYVGTENPCATPHCEGVRDYIAGNQLLNWVFAARRGSPALRMVVDAAAANMEAYHRTHRQLSCDDAQSIAGSGALTAAVKDMWQRAGRNFTAEATYARRALFLDLAVGGSGSDTAGARGDDDGGDDSAAAASGRRVCVLPQDALQSIYVRHRYESSWRST